MKQALAFPGVSGVFGGFGDLSDHARRLFGHILALADVWTQAAEDLLVDILDGTTSVPANWYIGWGTGAGTAAKGDTTLFTEAAETREVATLSQPASDQSRYVATMTSASGQTITNAGVLSALTVGTLWIHFDHTGVLLAISDKITYTITATWA